MIGQPRDQIGALRVTNPDLVDMPLDAQRAAHEQARANTLRRKPGFYGTAGTAVVAPEVQFTPAITEVSPAAITAPVAEMGAQAPVAPAAPTESA